jgi:hypothetical protein
MKEEMRENLIDKGIWMRGVFMVLFFIAYSIVEVLILLVALFQFVAVLFTGRVNETVLRLGNNLSFFALETFQYLTFNSNLRPFPFSPWPNEEPGGGLWRDNEVADTEFEEIKANADDDIKNVDT